MDAKSFNKELEIIFHSLEFEEAGGIEIADAKWTSNDLIIGLKIRTGITDEIKGWYCTCRGIRKESISRNKEAEYLEVYENHPLAWEYNNYETELYFSSSPKYPHQFITRLLEVHEQSTGGWIPLDEYVNYGQLSLLKLCSSSNALFAKGPISLLKIYADLIREFEMKPKILGEFEPTYWDGEKYEPETIPKQVLLIGQSYIVAEEFDFNKA